MLLPVSHEVLGPGLHRFVFLSKSRPGLTHELLLDLQEEGAGRLSCLCEASLHGRLCKHKRLLILGLEPMAEAGESYGHKHPPARPGAISHAEVGNEAEAGP